MMKSGIKSFAKGNLRIAWVIMPLLLFYFIFDPQKSVWMPQCIFHKFTGLQCMGCGAQRMLHALLHGNLQEALQANAFLFCSLPFILFLFWVELNRKSFPDLYKRIHSLPLIIAVSASLIVWLILRNIIGI